LERKRNCGWSSKGNKPEEVVWLWQPEGARDALAITECPVSYVTGESAAFLEDFYAHETIGGRGNILDWPARRVDAHFVLKAEQRRSEPSVNG